MSDITIYYNPFCVVSRNALMLIRHAGIEPTVIGGTGYALHEIVSTSEVVGLAVRDQPEEDYH